MIESRQLDIKTVYPNPDQPRQHFDEAGLRELADSIEQSGLLQPIAVRETDDGYQIIHGERRWRAHQLAGLETIRAEIHDVTSDDAYTLSVIENEQREDISPIETARAIKKLMDMHGVSQTEVAKRLSRSRSWVAQKLRLLNLGDDIQSFIKTDELSEGHARQLLKMQNAGGDPAQISDIAQKAVSGSWSVRRIESEVNNVISGSVSRDTSELRLDNNVNSSVSRDNIAAFKEFWQTMTPGQQGQALKWLGVSRDNGTVKSRIVEVV